MIIFYFISRTREAVVEYFLVILSVVRGRLWLNIFLLFYQSYAGGCDNILFYQSYAGGCG